MQKINPSWPRQAIKQTPQNNQKEPHEHPDGHRVVKVRRLRRLYRFTRNEISGDVTEINHRTLRSCTVISFKRDFCRTQL